MSKPDVKDLAPGSPALDQLWAAVRAMFERPEYKAVIRKFSIVKPKGEPVLSGGRYRHEVYIHIIVDTDEPKTHKELEDQMYRESLSNWVRQYMKDPAAATARSSDEVQRFTNGILADAEALGVPTTGRSLRGILEDLAAMAPFRNKKEAP